MDGLIEGRNVHYVNEFGDHLAAIVSKVEDKAHGYCLLTIFKNTASLGSPVYSDFAFYSELKESKTWHFIERA